MNLPWSLMGDKYYAKETLYKKCWGEVTTPPCANALRERYPLTCQLELKHLEMEVAPYGGPVGISSNPFCDRPTVFFLLPRLFLPP